MDTCLGCQGKRGWVVHISEVSVEERVGGHMFGVSVEREDGRYTCLGCQGKRLRMGGTHVWSANGREDGWTHVWGVSGREGRWYTCLGCQEKIGWAVHMSGVSGEDRVGGTHVWGVRRR